MTKQQMESDQQTECMPGTFANAIKHQNVGVSVWMSGSALNVSRKSIITNCVSYGYGYR